MITFLTIVGIIFVIWIVFCNDQILMKADIQKLTNQGKWTKLKTFKGENSWIDAIDETCILRNLSKEKYRVITADGYVIF